MPTRNNVSAGILLFRRRKDELEFFLAHPGGPFWVKRDAGAWTIPKGEVNDAESPLDAAKREFFEETGITLDEPFLPLGCIKQKAGKVVHAWAAEGDADSSTIKSNTVRCEWPPRSGRMLIVPEIDRCEWFSEQIAREKINSAQVPLIDRLKHLL